MPEFPWYSPIWSGNCRPVDFSKCPLRSGKKDIHKHACKEKKHCEALKDLWFYYFLAYSVFSCSWCFFVVVVVVCLFVFNTSPAFFFNSIWKKKKHKGENMWRIHICMFIDILIHENIFENEWNDCMAIIKCLYRRSDKEIKKFCCLCYVATEWVQYHWKVASPQRS